MSRSLFRKVVRRKGVPDDVDPAEELRRQLDEGEPPVAKRHWWSGFTRLSSNVPGGFGNGVVIGLRGRPPEGTVIESPEGADES